MNQHLESVEEVAKALDTSSKGLSSNVAAERIGQFGKNQLEAKKKKTIAGMLLSQLTDFMILILVAAAIISGILAEWTDTIVILAIVVLNALAGVIQEWRAEKAMEALESMASANAKVIRDGRMADIPSEDLVPGDVVSVEAGNVIPADVRFFETHSLRVNESSLTGESVDVEKKTEKLPPKDYPLGDRVNMGYKGTSVTNGRGLAFVTATGMKTELGKIAGMIQKEETRTPLQKRLDAFGKRLTIIIIILCIVFFFVGWWRGESLSTMLLTSISLAVAAIPEALPALVTIALSLGAKRLVKSNALIRKLPAVETLGSVTYICSDKTGTLTLNRMTVEETYDVEGFNVSGLSLKKDLLLHAMALNNDVSRSDDQQWMGESTEVALVAFASEKGYERGKLEQQYPRTAEIPFDSSRKCMTTLHQMNDGKVLVIVKGAVGVLFQKLVPEQVSEVELFRKNVDRMADKGYRTLGFAIRLLDQIPTNISPETIEHSLTFIGVAGMMDPPREEAKSAVAACKGAGITPVMITGDHRLTAKAIASQLGIISSDKELALTGTELKALSENEFNEKVEQIRVYARVDPEQKLKIVSALQQKGHFVGMTGDGVNDAPALKNADIGIAMGINGTEVSKEASHMILLDDNFATIVKAVEHGRRIFDNILKFIKYIMTGNSGEIWALFLAPFFGLPIPLLAIHILWVNLITDGLPGLALASEPADANVMKRLPRDPKASIFAGGMGAHILWVGLLIGIVTLGMQKWAIDHDEHWQTMAFTVLCFAQLWHVLAIRSDERSLFSLGFFSNPMMLVAIAITVTLQFAVIYLPVLNRVFHTEPLTAHELLLTIAVSSIIFFAVELEKLIKRQRSGKYSRSS